MHAEAGNASFTSLYYSWIYDQFHINKNHTKFKTVKEPIMRIYSLLKSDHDHLKWRLPSFCSLKESLKQLPKTNISSR